MKTAMEIWMTIVIGVLLWFLLGVASGLNYCPAVRHGGHGQAPAHGTTN